MDELTVWAAGFFDGEGCVQITKHKRQSSRHRFQAALDVGLSQKTRKPLDLIQARWGGRVYTDRGCYLLRLKTLAAEKFLHAILPYVQVKTDQILLALEYRKELIGQPRCRKHAYTVAEIARVDEFIRELKRLKRAG